MDRVKRIAGTMLAVCAVFLLAAACGSTKKESSSATTTSTGTTVSQTTGATYIGSFACFRCHNDGNALGGMIKPFGDTQTASATAKGWLNGKHANLNASPVSSIAEWSVGSCATCHDTGADGTTAASFIFDAGLDNFTASTSRPMVGCESCHGAGGNHYGVGPVEYNRPGPAVCKTCHDASSSHATVASRTAPTYGKEWNGVYTDYSTGAHASSLATSVFASGSTTTVMAKCSRCHTDEGAKYYLPKWSGAESGSSSYAELNTYMTSKPDVPSASAVQCRTCHDGHNTGRLIGRAGAEAIVSVSGAATVLSNITGGAWSEEFATCNSCHQLLKADGTTNSSSFHDPVVNSDTTVAPADKSRIISDTHVATAGYWGAAGSSANTTAPITGYPITPSSARACGNCHNPHSANVTINRQWHASLHGGASPSDPWSHYDWSQANRAACQRCHSTTGLVGFLTAYTAAGGSAGVASLTATQLGNLYNRGNTAGTGTYITAPAINTWKPEMLQCQGCHTDNKGTLRDPGPFTSPYYYGDTSPETWDGTLADQVTFPDVKGSNICITCHVGRESGGSIMARTATWSSGTSFTNSHYLTAGGVVFKSIGFHYYSVSPNYDNPSYYQHDKIGLAASNNVGGSNGPCVGCHMTATANSTTNYGSHRFQPVTKNGSGVITEINTTVCATCHSGSYSMTAAEMETQNEELQAALTVAEELMFNKGYCFNKASNPYWFTPGASFPTCTSTSKTSWATSAQLTADASFGKKTMGAAFNINMIAHDPGAYAHNRFYVKRLLYDSIDWMDDYVINQSTPGYLNGLTASTTKTNAIAYLISTSSTASYVLSGTGTSQTGGRP